jgi:hypothetical protein
MYKILIGAIIVTFFNSIFADYTDEEVDDIIEAIENRKNQKNFVPKNRLPNLPELNTNILE